MQGRKKTGEKTFPLKHFDRDLFVYYPYAEIPAYPSAVTFTIGADQKAMQVVIEDLNSICGTPGKPLTFVCR